MYSVRWDWLSYVCPLTLLHKLTVCSVFRASSHVKIVCYVLGRCKLAEFSSFEIYTKNRCCKFYLAKLQIFQMLTNLLKIYFPAIKIAAQELQPKNFTEPCKCVEALPGNLTTQLILCFVNAEQKCSCQDLQPPTVHRRLRVPQQHFA